MDCVSFLRGELGEGLVRIDGLPEAFVLPTQPLKATEPLLQVGGLGTEEEVTGSRHVVPQSSPALGGRVKRGGVLGKHLPHGVDLSKLAFCLFQTMPGNGKRCCPRSARANSLAEDAVEVIDGGLC